MDPSSTESPPTVADLGARSGGVWTRSEALEVLTRNQVDERLADGTWQRLLAGVYADRGIAPDASMRCWAAVRASGDHAVLSARSAARLWGLPLVDDDDPATGRRDRHQHDVAVPEHRASRTSLLSSDSRKDVVNRRQLRLLKDEVEVRSDGLRLTTVPRTLRDLAHVLPLDALVCAVDHALAKRLVTLELLAEHAGRAKGTRQAARFREAVALADARAESPAESLARLLLLPHFPGLVPQVQVRDRWGGLVAVLDLADEALKLAVEVDGKRGHAGPQMVARDRRRDERTEAFGWWTVRVTWWELRRQPQRVVSRVLARAERLRRTA